MVNSPSLVSSIISIMQQAMQMNGHQESNPGPLAGRWCYSSGYTGEPLTSQRTVIKILHTRFKLGARSYCSVEKGLSFFKGPKPGSSPGAAARIVFSEPAVLTGQCCLRWSVECEDVIPGASKRVIFKVTTLF
ncbi:uncharacterized protein LOC143681205 [Tamandua tetradactyla]|uniref:uncharacterized protein LOC143681205 n=1 Tax=Tamandua tetradactyla TaxID=48850 RepID=UPI00405389CF